MRQEPTPNIPAASVNKRAHLVTNKELRGREIAQCVGGLRDPWRAVHRLPGLQRLRSLLRVTIGWEGVHSKELPAIGVRMRDPN